MYVFSKNKRTKSSWERGVGKNLGRLTKESKHTNGTYTIYFKTYCQIVQGKSINNIEIVFQSSSHLIQLCVREGVSKW